MSHVRFRLCSCGSAAVPAREVPKRTACATSWNTWFSKAPSAAPRSHRARNGFRRRPCSKRFHFQGTDLCFNSKFWTSTCPSLRRHRRPRPAPKIRSEDVKKNARWSSKNKKWTWTIPISSSRDFHAWILAATFAGAADSRTPETVKAFIASRCLCVSGMVCTRSSGGHRRRQRPHQQVSAIWCSAEFGHMKPTGARGKRRRSAKLKRPSISRPSAIIEQVHLCMGGSVGPAGA